MPSVDNRTPFASSLIPHVNGQGQHCQLLVAKGVWSLRNQALADRPGCLGLYQSPHLRRIGQLQLSTLQRQVLGSRIDEEIEWFPSDVYPVKPGFDFIVCGYACSAQPQEQFHAAIRYRNTAIELQLRAPRFWKPTLVTGAGAIPGPFLELVTQVPVHPAFAFGGDLEASPPSDNPQGMGQPSRRQELASLAMPWVEHPQHRINSMASTTEPAAFGPWPASARLRSRYCGTFDKRWQQERSPLPPSDFDSRHYNQADPRLQWAQAPKAAEVIELYNLGIPGAQRIVWPDPPLHVKMAHRPAIRLRPDTCIVSPQDGLYALLWRCEIEANASPTLSVF